MLTNAKVGTKLLALIIAPVMVLLAVASVGARDRLDDATEAGRVQSAAEVTALTDAAVRSLGDERLFSAASITDEPRPELVEARAATDVALAELRPVLSSISRADGFVDGLDQVEGRLEGLRSSIDDGGIDAELAIDAYSLAIDELIGLGGEVAATTSATELSLALTNANVLTRAQEVRSQLAAYGAAAIGLGQFDAGDLQRFTDLREEQDRMLARYADGASAEEADQLQDALATPEVVAADAQLDAMVSDATIGGAAEPQITMDEWLTGQSRWLDTIGAVDQALVDDVIVAAADSEYSATKAARLFMIVTAIAALLSILLAVWVARSIDRPLRRLTSAADEMATERLPRLVENLRSPDLDAAEIETFQPVEVTSSDEIGKLTEALNAIQQVTVNVAEEQSTLLRRGIGDIFINLARRNQSLLDRQIEFIDELESREQDPDLLENLFRLDHLATRMRRNAESLLVLAGSEPARRRSKPVALADVVRVAIGEVEDFTRVELLDLDEALVAGNLAVDLSHLLSELMENATHFSPPESSVEVAGQFGSGGAFVLTVADHGIGMSGEDLAEANGLLANPPLVGLALGRSLGFIVVGRIAVRLGLRVHLNASPAGGVTAVISLPGDLVARPGDPEPRDPLLDRSQEPPAPPSGLPAAPADSTLAENPLLPLDGRRTPPPADSLFTSESSTIDAPPTESAPVESAPIDGPPPPPPTEAAPSEPPFAGGEGPAPLPTRGPEAPTSTDRLADVLPEGPEFEEGLAALIGPESSDDDVERQFWGSLADGEEEPAASAAPEPAPSPAPDPVPAPGPAADPGPEEPAQAGPAEIGPTGLVRRVPGAAAESPAPTGPAADAPRRSPEEVRAMLSRYRDGLKGPRGEDASPTDGAITEDSDD